MKQMRLRADKTWVLSWTGVILVLIAMTMLHLLWLHWFATVEQGVAQKGELDLRSWQPENGEVLTLDGEWAFYPEKFLLNEQFENVGVVDAPTSYPATQPLWLNVPGNWGMAWEGKEQPAFGYGTYRLKIHVSPEAHQKYGIHVPSILTSARLYVNGELLHQTGSPGVDKAQTKAYNTPINTTFFADNEGLIDLVIHASNFSYLEAGGIEISIQLGAAEALQRNHSIGVMMQQIVFIVYLLHAFYACYLYLFGIKEPRLLFLALILLTLTISLAGNGDKLLLEWFPLTFTGDYDLKGICLAVGGAAFVHAAVDRQASRASKIFVWAVSAVALLMVFFILVPIFNLLAIQWVFAAYTLICLIVSLVWVLRSPHNHFMSDPFLQLIMLCLVQVVIWEYVYIVMNVKVVFYPVDMLVAIVCLTSIWFRRYKRMTNQTIELAEKLQRQDKIKDEFLANTSHELRNPLHGILNMSQSVLDRERKLLGGQSVRELELVLSIGRRMNYMLGDLLDIARLKESGIQLQVEPVHLHTMVTKTMGMLQFLIKDTSLKIVNEVPSDLPLMNADENRLTQVLFNLLHNAIKFSDRGIIRISVETDKEKICIRVEDQGIGMDPQQLIEVFKPYEQVKGDISGSRGGFGLGLSISKQLVELHGGELAVTSTLGKGSCFTIVLPQALGWLQGEQSISEQIMEPWAKSNAVEQLVIEELQDLDTAASLDVEDEALVQASSPSKRLSILAVDDDPVNLQVLANVFLVDQGYDLVATTNPLKVMDMLHTRRWDLVIVDVMMPHISGYALSSLIRERFDSYELPILLLTARNRPEDIEAGLLAGANDYVCKPVNAIELRARAHTLTQFKQAVAERLNFEAAWLQAQIKPHFIMNTLNAIIALSDVDHDRMLELVNEFSTYLRASYEMHNAQQLVRLRVELELVQSYLNIELERFGSRLQVIWNVEENLDMLMPPLLIQPLVENAVTHGVLSQNKGGTVTITISQAEAGIEVCISDDGIGMSEERIAQILTNRSTNGIGVYNTHQRLRQLYGLGLTIVSQPDQGTTVSFVAKELRGRY